jgi:lysine-N-methylase
MLPIKTLPLLENWECRGCTYCCRGTTVPLDKTDLAKLREQQWDKTPELAGVKTVVRETLLGGRRVLAKRPDGSCVFLTDEGRCRIHELHGLEAKPAVCRMFPFQLVRLDRFAYLTPRRSCPSASAGQGRPVSEYLARLKKSGLVGQFTPSEAAPPAVTRGARRNWREFLAAADALTRLMTDERLPVVRRLVHGLQFCTLLDHCRLAKAKEESVPELMEMLETAAPENAGDFFRDRQPPSPAAGSLLRQVGVHYIRSHPGFQAGGSWRERWQLMWMSTSFARGKGQTPPIHPDFPATPFDQLERPLGPLDESIALPLYRFFETYGASKQYALANRRQPLVKSFRALAFTYPIALWLLRLAIGEREPTQADVVNIVVALERGQGMAAVSRAASAIASMQQLERLVAWYAR